MRVCFRCKVEKSLDDFYVSGKDREHGRAYECKTCIRERRRAWNAANPDALRAAKRRHNHNKRLRAFGLTCEEYESMLAAQGGVCAICRNPESVVHGETLRPLSIDHNHETGEVRGLLCGSCNLMLGHAKDDPDRLMAAVAYLLAQPVTVARGT